ncbi:stigma-specific STIG1-like protein 2 [Carya illinoinensis]|uniref:Stigma-specific STIG1-like protein 1 n=1 Tax=Carya illinoinensis TaxID=32201 RepID=A0A8T1PDA2_CARIL|nr:stigma-specific STIG1-like protein 2 [Carya illinoinensis]KAG6639047.1 hypothetical protein CIPAW_10G073600 [Carya illinoinensis]
MTSLITFIELPAILMMALTITSLSATQPDHDQGSVPAKERPTSLRGTGRFLAEKTRVTLTCDKYPKVCGENKGSPGPDCCQKRCADLMKDRLNCGECGKKCKYSELCCKGKCVNPMSTKQHCGSCGNNCDKESLCTYGICGYAYA